MRRVRSVTLLVLVTVWLGGAVPSAAGGGSTFQFRRMWFAPGQVVGAATEFSDWAGAQASVANGPWFAYLIRGDRFIQPPHLPSNAIRIGLVKMTHARGTMWKASLHFAVPSVRPGRYTVSLCNVPCRSAYVGDLLGGWIYVATSAEQAKLRNIEAAISERVSAQTSDLYDRLDRLGETVAAGQSRTLSVGTDLRLYTIENRTKAMDARIRRLGSRTDPGLTAWLWLSGWLVAGAIATAWWRSRRRRPQHASVSLVRAAATSAGLPD